MSERLIRVKSCLDCPHHGVRWHSKLPTHYCEYFVTGKKQEDYGEELNILDLIPLFCPLEIALNSKKLTELVCDKSKEPPCHLEPSKELCQKCLLNGSVT
jgi:hypothetical protein